MNDNVYKMLSSDSGMQTSVTCPELVTDRINISVNLVKNQSIWEISSSVFRAELLENPFQVLLVIMGV